MLTPEEQEQLKDELDSLLLFEIQARLRFRRFLWT